MRGALGARPSATDAGDRERWRTQPPATGARPVRAPTARSTAARRLVRFGCTRAGVCTRGRRRVVVEHVRHDDRAAPDGRRADAERGDLRGDGSAAAREEADERVDPRRARRARRRPREADREDAVRARKSSDSTAGPGDRERGRELVVREPAELAQEQRVPLLARQRLDRRPERGEVGAANRLGERVGRSRGRLELLHGQRLAHARADPRPALVARDRREPRRRLARLGAVQERAVRREEGLLRGVLGLGAIAQQRAAEPPDGAPVVAVELLGPRSGRPVVGAAAADGARRGAR